MLDDRATGGEVACQHRHPTLMVDRLVARCHDILCKAGRSRINFLAQTATSHSQLIAQGVFLERLGITARAQSLANALSGPALESHIAAHRRLTHPEEMGSLFKTLALFPKGAPPPPGYDL